MATVNEAKLAAEAPPLPEMGTPAQVAQYLHTTTASLAQARYHGTGVAYVKNGRKVLYRWSDVRAYMAANTVVPGGDAA